jgi:hypothetical protein
VGLISQIAQETAERPRREIAGEKPRQKQHWMSVTARQTAKQWSQSQGRRQLARRPALEEQPEFRRRSDPLLPGPMRCLGTRHAGMVPDTPWRLMPRRPKAMQWTAEITIREE